MSLKTIDESADVLNCQLCDRSVATYWMERIYDNSIILDRVCGECAKRWQIKAKRKGLLKK